MGVDRLRGRGSSRASRLISESKKLVLILAKGELGHMSEEVTRLHRLGMKSAIIAPPHISEQILLKKICQTIPEKNKVGFL